MLKRCYKTRSGNRGNSILFFLLAAFITVFALPAQANEMCTRGPEALRGDYEVFQGRGGLWTLMEQAGLKDQSVMGLQVDSKILRTIVALEMMCEDGKTPDRESFIKVRDLISDGRMVFNLKIDRTPSEKYLKIISDLSIRADELLKSLGQ